MGVYAARGVSQRGGAPRRGSRSEGGIRRAVERTREPLAGDAAGGRSRTSGGDVNGRPRNRAGRLPSVTTLDFSLVRPWRLWKYRFNAGLKVYNALGAGAERDVQANVSSPEYGRFFNAIPRSVGLAFGLIRATAR